MKRFDPTIPLGLAVGTLALLAAAQLEGVRLAFLWQPTALLVVAGGTLGATLVRRGASGVREAWASVVASLWREPADEIDKTRAQLDWLARAWRREGARALEAHASRLADPLVREGLLLAADLAEPAVLRHRLEMILADEDETGSRDAATLEAAGGYAPTFGIVGAVLGLIGVLRQLADPGALGAGIATAFVATIYGVGAANLLLFPLASRLRERHRDRMKRREGVADLLLRFARRETNAGLSRATTRSTAAR